MMGAEIEAILWDDWHVVAELETIVRVGHLATALFGIPLTVSAERDGGAVVVRSLDATPLAVTLKYGFVWACMGTPARPVVDFPEFAEADRFVVTGGSAGVHVSGLRAVENFLDMGHFPFVHTDYLGVEPHTEVAPYTVALSADDEVLATDCSFFQPFASASASGGLTAEYVYKVLRPYTAVLYKTNPQQPQRKDFIALMAQPVDEERCVAHSLLMYLKDGADERAVRWFMQLIFGQDKPILENQVPKRLPLDTRAEMPVRADACSTAYRRWLGSHQVRYGAIPALSSQPVTS
jgi:phenylpropionate dioxygenase-like ring-hydroxylating dioxygenase large terminal subunit